MTQQDAYHRDGNQLPLCKDILEQVIFTAGTNKFPLFRAKVAETEFFSEVL
jgi:hypothetical protein